MSQHVWVFVVVGAVFGYWSRRLGHPLWVPVTGYTLAVSVWVRLLWTGVWAR